MIAPRVGWDDYVHLAFDEIRHYSGRSMQVARRLTAAVEDLLTLASGDRRGVLQEQLDLLQRAVHREFDDPLDYETLGH